MYLVLTWCQFALSKIAYGGSSWCTFLGMLLVVRHVDDIRNLSGKEHENPLWALRAIIDPRLSQRGGGPVGNSNVVCKILLRKINLVEVGSWII